MISLSAKSLAFCTSSSSTATCRLLSGMAWLMVARRGSKGGHDGNPSANLQEVGRRGEGEKGVLEPAYCTLGTAATRGHASGATSSSARNPADPSSSLNPRPHTLAKGMEERRRQRETGERRLCQRDSSPLAACRRVRPSGAVQVQNVPSCASAWLRLIPPREPAAAEPQKGASPAPFIFPW
jgi:hypothetical protein